MIAFQQLKRLMMRRRAQLLFALFAACAACEAGAVTLNWKGATTGIWDNAANWVEGVAPTNGGEDVYITNSGARVFLTNATVMLGSFTIGNEGGTSNTLIFTNWATFLMATNIAIRSNGALTCAGPYSNSPVTMSNRVWLICTNLVIDDGGAIDVNWRGYKGGVNSGPGGGQNLSAAGGGGHGGMGSWGTQNSGVAGRCGKTNDTAEAPFKPGSGGGYSTAVGGTSSDGHAGGAVRIEADAVLVNGRISADGKTPTGDRGGGGSGGSVWITCRTFAGTNGAITANGADGTGIAGSGGGGRIAIVYDPAAQDGVPLPEVAIEVRPGERADIGTLYFTDGRFVVTNVTRLQGQLVGMTEWRGESLMVSNCWIRFPEPGFQMTVTNDLLVLGSSGRLDIGGNAVVTGGISYYVNSSMTSAPVVLIGGNLVVTNRAYFYVFAGETNAATTNYGALVSVTGTVFLGKHGALYPVSHAENGGSVLWRMGRLEVLAGSTNAGVNANWGGYRGGVVADGVGPGGGDKAAFGTGGGYGGTGAVSISSSVSGPEYGTKEPPLFAGSGGGSGNTAFGDGGRGGGLVWIETTGHVEVAGTISANGMRGYEMISSSATNGGGGSGGGIWITCGSYSQGTGGVLEVKGGRADGEAGGGGGGRIALVITETGAPELMIFDKSGGGGGYADGAAGTEYVYGMNRLEIWGDPGNYGSPTNEGYGIYYVAPESWVTNGVESPADEANGVRYACIGYAVTNQDGDVLTNGTGWQALVEMTTNVALRWNWTNEFELVETSGPNGYVTNLSGWYTNATVLALVAVPSNDYVFSQWTGTGVPLGSETNNPLILTMNQPREVQVNFCFTGGVAKLWNGGFGNWETIGQWTPSGVPGLLDTAYIGSGTSMISAPVYVSGVSVSNAVLLFTNWSCELNANGTVYFGTNAIVTCPSNVVNGVLSNRVAITCGDLFLGYGAKIDVNFKGYGGGKSSSTTGPAVNGKGSGTATGSAGHGGRGSGTVANYLTGGATYDAYAAPTLMGSGGGDRDNRGSGGQGGGAVKIVATGTVTVNGTIRANGQRGHASYTSGGGSGGSIWIDTVAFAGTNGLVQANGGISRAGGGGGGRIALTYDPAAQDLLPLPWVRFVADGGTSTVRDVEYCVGNDGDIGTLYFTDERFLASPISHVGQVIISNMVSLATNSLVVSNGTIRFYPPGFALTVTGDVLITATGSLQMGANTYGSFTFLAQNRNTTTSAPVLSVGGSMTLTNQSSLSMWAGATNNATAAYGALVDVAGDVNIGEGSWIYPHSNPTNGGSVLMRFGNLYLGETTNCGISADQRGFDGGRDAAGYGPGRAAKGGGGFGGTGGMYAGGGGGPSNGAPYNPAYPGSGGGSTDPRMEMEGGTGGGFVWIETGVAGINGLISAVGRQCGVNYSSAGSGGGINIWCQRFYGTNTGCLQVGGGYGDFGGGGGGGRIAVWIDVPASEKSRIIQGDLANVTVTNAYVDYLGTSLRSGGSSTGGGPSNGAPGTVYFIIYYGLSGTVYQFY